MCSKSKMHGIQQVARTIGQGSSTLNHHAWKCALLRLWMRRKEPPAEPAHQLQHQAQCILYLWSSWPHLQTSISVHIQGQGESHHLGVWRT
ncbi:hypothetical protein DUNSADRAFT_15724 [Dunaliella salina]|uniref:Encoded protein n=1 Tax=Dunaliella salina TaxID=3046 RepID=A0ABQ7H998_DUNSA|nr:hypothetical protein DUNSADRAFT_15724 [Dunaliella salina]|eukprot:KAF5843429.1 hypothetical protein DUNSADRAFT_15724 [Dunaliella salina]